MNIGDIVRKMRTLNNKPKVSVIIPTYGRPKTLKRAIDSVINQTYLNYEIIIVDDNNPNTQARKETEICMISYNHINNVKYFKHDCNKNGAAARNTGILNCTGDYLCFLDDDDWFLPDKLRVQVEKLLENNKFDAVCCGWIKNGIRYSANIRGDLTKRLLMLDYYPMTPTLMFTRKSVESIGGFNEMFRRHQDYELMLRFLERYTITSVADFLVEIGVNVGENAMHGQELEGLKEQFLNNFKNNILVLEKKETGISKKIYCKHYSRVFWNHVHYKYYKLAIKVFKRFIVYSPVNFCRYSIEYLVYAFNMKLKRRLNK